MFSYNIFIDFYTDIIIVNLKLLLQKIINLFLTFNLFFITNDEEKRVRAII